MSRPATTRSAVCCAACATASPSAIAFGLRQRKNFRRGIGGDDTCAQSCGAAGRLRQRTEQRAVDDAALGMKIGETLRKLGDLGDAAGDGDARHRMHAQIFEHAADKVAHVDQRNLGQIVELLHRGFRTRAGGAGDVGETGGARDIDAAVNRVDPRRARIRHDDPGGAEDRQPADDAEPSVESFCRQRFAAGNGDLDLGVGGASGRGGDFGDGITDHAPRYRIDGGLARRDRKAGPRHRADALARAKGHAVARRAGAHRREDERAMRHVGIVAGVLDHAGGSGIFVLSRQGEREAWALAARQRHLDRVGKFAGYERRKRRLRRRSGAGAGGPSPAQRALLPLHASPFSAARSDRHHGSTPP